MKEVVANKPKSIHAELEIKLGHSRLGYIRVIPNQARPQGKGMGGHTPIQLGTASGEIQQSSSTFELAIPNLQENFPVSGRVMPGLQENLIGIGPICDADYSVTFTKDTVIIYSPNRHRVMRGWREKEGP